MKLSATVADSLKTDSPPPPFLCSSLSLSSSQFSFHFLHFFHFTNLPPCLTSPSIHSVSWFFHYQFLTHPLKLPPLNTGTMQYWDCKVNDIRQECNAMSKKCKLQVLIICTVFSCLVIQCRPSPMKAIFLTQLFTANWIVLTNNAHHEAISAQAVYKPDWMYTSSNSARLF